ncbi:hypothetical protein FACS1894103_3590 [Campylobacterota bacterium]|nr:hypothetical protein FACS1894103_3590 [Campylobacterota bacterium]
MPFGLRAQRHYRIDRADHARQVKTHLQIGAFKKGDIIKHKLFGMGRVVAVAQAGREQKLSINFSGIQRDILSNFVERI